MTEEQKIFKILKRTSYEEQISQESKDATKRTFIVGASAAAAFSAFTAAASPNADFTIMFIECIAGLASAGLGAYNLKELIEAISKKTQLQSKVEDINTELEMPENEEDKGMRRWQLTLRIL